MSVGAGCRRVLIENVPKAESNELDGVKYTAWLLRYVLA